VNAEAQLTSNHDLHFALKEFFGLLRTNDSRTDFSAVYCKESDELTERTRGDMMRTWNVPYLRESSDFRPLH